MKEEDLTIIKSRPLVLKNGERSSEIVLADNSGDGDMFFTFEIRYVNDVKEGQTTVTVKDKFHASFVIGVMPNAFTRPSDFIRIGSYGAEKKPLYLGFVVQPQIAESGEHNVIVTFYTSKK